MPRRPYPTDLTDRAWAILEPRRPPAKPGGRRRRVDLREILNGIYALLRRGGAWRRLPHDRPPWPTRYAYFRGWQRAGAWAARNRTRREQVRRSGNRAATPSAAVLDSQSVTTTAHGGHAAMMRGRRSREESGIWASLRSG